MALTKVSRTLSPLSLRLLSSSCIAKRHASGANSSGANKVDANATQQPDVHSSDIRSNNKQICNTEPERPPPPQKTVSQLDEELRQKMAGLSGDGGESGIEYEDGQPVAMKRSVKNNMFRYI